MTRQVQVHKHEFPTWYREEKSHSKKSEWCAPFFFSQKRCSLQRALEIEKQSGKTVVLNLNGQMKKRDLESLLSMFYHQLYSTDCKKYD